MLTNSLYYKTKYFLHRTNISYNLSGEKLASGLNNCQISCDGIIRQLCNTHTTTTIYELFTVLLKAMVCSTTKNFTFNCLQDYIYDVTLMITKGVLDTAGNRRVTKSYTV